MNPEVVLKIVREQNRHIKDSFNSPKSNHLNSNSPSPKFQAPPLPTALIQNSNHQQHISPRNTQRSNMSDNNINTSMQSTSPYSNQQKIYFINNKGDVDYIDENNNRAKIKQIASNTNELNYINKNKQFSNKYSPYPANGGDYTNNYSQSGQMQSNNNNNNINSNHQYNSIENTISRSGSVKSVASDSGVGSSSPLSDCSDYGANNNNSNINNSNKILLIQQQMHNANANNNNNNNNEVIITHAGQINSSKSMMTNSNLSMMSNSSSGMGRQIALSQNLNNSNSSFVISNNNNINQQSGSKLNEPSLPTFSINSTTEANFNLAASNQARKRKNCSNIYDEIIFDKLNNKNQANNNNSNNNNDVVFVDCNTSTNNNNNNNNKSHQIENFNANHNHNNSNSYFQQQQQQSKMPIIYPINTNLINNNNSKSHDIIQHHLHAQHNNNSNQQQHQISTKHATNISNKCDKECCNGSSFSSLHNNNNNNNNNRSSSLSSVPNLNNLVKHTQLEFNKTMQSLENNNNTKSMSSCNCKECNLNEVMLANQANKFNNQMNHHHQQQQQISHSAATSSSSYCNCAACNSKLAQQTPANNAPKNGGKAFNVLIQNSIPIFNSQSMDDLSYMKTNKSIHQQQQQQQQQSNKSYCTLECCMPSNKLKSPGATVMYHHQSNNLQQSPSNGVKLIGSHNSAFQQTSSQQNSSIKVPIPILPVSIAPQYHQNENGVLIKPKPTPQFDYRNASDYNEMDYLRKNSNKNSVSLIMDLNSSSNNSNINNSEFGSPLLGSLMSNKSSLMSPKLKQPPNNAASVLYDGVKVNKPENPIASSSSATAILLANEYNDLISNGLHIKKMKNSFYFPQQQQQSSSSPQQLEMNAKIAKAVNNQMQINQQQQQQQQKQNFDMMTSMHQQQKRKQSIEMQMQPIQPKNAPFFLKSPSEMNNLAQQHQQQMLQNHMGLVKKTISINSLVENNNNNNNQNMNNKSPVEMADSSAPVANYNSSYPPHKKYRSDLITINSTKNSNGASQQAMYDSSKLNYKNAKQNVITSTHSFLVPQSPSKQYQFKLNENESRLSDSSLATSVVCLGLNGKNGEDDDDNDIELGEVVSIDKIKNNAEFKQLAHQIDGELENSSKPVEASAMTLSDDDVPVIIPKKILPMVTPRIIDWLEKCVELVHRTSIKTSIDLNELFGLLVRAWPKLLLVFMIENSFEFFVSKDYNQLARTNGGAEQNHSAAEIGDRAVSNVNRLPKEKDAVKLHSIISKGNCLYLKAQEYDELREIILLKEGEYLVLIRVVNFLIENSN